MLSRHVVLEVRVLEARDLLEGREVAVDDRAARQVELGALGVERQVRHRQVVGHPAAVAEPLGVHRADRGDVRQVDLLHERRHLVEEVLHHEQLFHVQRGLVVEVDGVRHAADGEVLDVGGLAAEDRDHLVGLELVLERLQVVSHRQQVDLRRQLHRRVAPVAVGEDPELAAGDEARELVLDRLHLALRVVRPGRQALAQRGGLRRIGLERRRHVHPVERRQVVEVHHVVVQRVGGHDHVADVLRVDRDLDARARSRRRAPRRSRGPSCTRRTGAG